MESTTEAFRPGDWVLAIPDRDEGLAEFFVAEAAKAVPLSPEVASAAHSCQTLVMTSLDVAHAVRQN